METWLALIVVAVGVLLAAVAGLHVYVTATATRLHPEPAQVPSTATTAAAPQWRDAAERGRQIVRAAVSEQNLPAVSVAVGVRGALVWAEGFGWADLRSRLPVSPQTRFRIGTASKVLTSAAVGLLLERHRLDLDTEIQTYVPQFPRKEWPVTLRHLAGHRAGIGTDAGDEGPLLSQRCWRPVEGVNAFAEQPLLFAPGTAYRYSSYGWILVSAAVEAAAHEPFMTFMRTQVFEPLEMDHTTADSATEAIGLRATPYFPRYAADPRYGADLMRPVDHSCYAGASAFLSTPSDLVRFGMAIDRGTLLQPATVQLLQTSQRLPSEAETGYGLGWALETVTLAGAPTRVVGHDGESLGGRVASLKMLGDRGIVVAVTSNISYADTPSLALKVAEAFIAADRKGPRPDTGTSRGPAPGGPRPH